jgi:uncharacterized membrane protein
VPAIEYSTVVNRPLEDVFTYLVDIEKQLQWQSGLLKSEVTSWGPMGVGTTYRQVGQIMGRTIEWNSEVTEYTPNRSLSFRSSAGSFTVRVRVTFSAIQGGAMVNIAIEADVGGLWSGPLLMDMVKTRVEADLRTAKNIIEAKAWHEPGTFPL